MCYLKSTVNNSLSSMSPPQHSYHTISSPEYSIKAKAQGINLETNFMNVIAVLIEEVNKSHKGIPENTQKIH